MKSARISSVLAVTDVPLSSIDKESSSMAKLSPDAIRMLVFLIIFLVIEFIAITLRILAKGIRGRPFQSHDYSCLVCFVSF